MVLLLIFLFILQIFSWLNFLFFKKVNACISFLITEKICHNDNIKNFRTKYRQKFKNPFNFVAKFLHSYILVIDGVLGKLKTVDNDFTEFEIFSKILYIPFRFSTSHTFYWTAQFRWLY